MESLFVTTGTFNDEPVAILLVPFDYKNASGVDKDIILNATFNLGKYLELFIKKQKDYGPCNIADFGEFGVLVRLNDKVRRLKNLLQKGESPSNESIEDTWMDVIGYGLIGLMLHRGEWITDGCEEE